MENSSVRYVPIIDTVWLYRSGDTWTNSDDVTVRVTERIFPLERFESLVVNKQVHFVLSKEPFVNHKTGNVDVGYECFIPQPGVTYYPFVDFDYDGPGQIVSRYDRNGVTVVGFLDSDC